MGKRFSAARCGRFVSMVLTVLLLTAGCKQREEPVSSEVKGAPLAVTILHGGLTNILPRIALEQGYFAEEGLTVTMKDLDGKLAFDGLMKGECNFAINAAPPIVLADPQRSPFAILATVLSDDDSTRIAARRDQGITKPPDLKGKRVGVKKGILSHRFLDLFLAKQNLKESDVTMVFMEPDKFLDALLSGEIDAFSMTNKAVSAAAKALGENAVVFAEPGLNPVRAILTTRLDIPLNRDSTPRVLKALVRAEEFALQDPAAAKALVAKAGNISPQETDGIWARSTITVALSNDLFAHLEGQYRWQMGHGGAAAEKMPDYLNLVSPEYLRAVKPGAVTVIKR